LTIIINDPAGEKRHIQPPAMVTEGAVSPQPTAPLMTLAAKPGKPAALIFDQHVAAILQLRERPHHGLVIEP